MEEPFSMEIASPLKKLLAAAAAWPSTAPSAIASGLSSTADQGSVFNFPSVLSSSTSATTVATTSPQQHTQTAIAASTQTAVCCALHALSTTTVCSSAINVSVPPHATDPAVPLDVAPSLGLAPQSPFATAPLRNTYLVASLNAAPSSGQIPLPVQTSSMVTSTDPSFRSALLRDKVPSFSQATIQAAPTPERKGSLMTISFADELYRWSVSNFDTALIGPLILRPGDKPWVMAKLKARLQSLWNPVGDWTISTMGKGYFTFRFSSMT